VDCFFLVGVTGSTGAAVTWAISLLIGFVDQLLAKVTE